MSGYCPGDLFAIPRIGNGVNTECLKQQAAVYEDLQVTPISQLLKRSRNLLTYCVH